MKRRSLASGILLAIAVIVFLLGPAWAQEPTPPNTGAFSFTASLNFPTSYYFRGIAQSNAGFHFQPYLELKANVYAGGDKDVLTGGFLRAAVKASIRGPAFLGTMTQLPKEVQLLAHPDGPTLPICHHQGTWDHCVARGA